MLLARKNISEDIKQRLNFIYARDYSTNIDVNINRERIQATWKEKLKPNRTITTSILC